jgi:hypothetical protein
MNVRHFEEAKCQIQDIWYAQPKKAPFFSKLLRK